MLWGQYPSLEGWERNKVLFSLWACVWICSILSFAAKTYYYPTAANEERAACLILIHSKQASTAKTEVSIWRRISKWLFLKLMLLFNYRANCWYQNRFSSWDPMDHSQQAAATRALSHDTSFLLSKFCTYTRYSELFCHRHSTIFFSSGTPHTSQAFIPSPPQSPVPPFFFSLFELDSLLWKRRESLLFVLGIWLWLSLWEGYVLCSKISPVCRQSVFLASL